MGQKFCRNRSIMHGFEAFLCFAIFVKEFNSLENLENSNWQPFLARQNFNENLAPFLTR